MRVSATGTFVFSWDQVEIDGLGGAAPSQMVTGAAWRWSGAAVRVEDLRSVLVLTGDDNDLNARAARHVQRMLDIRATVTPEPDDDVPANSFDLTDGLALYQATIVDAGIGRSPLVMFHDRLPPQGQDLWVLRQEVNAQTHQIRENGLLCFVPGTFIETERGAVRVEELTDGDRVQTQDNGCQPILWSGRKHVSGGRILAMPSLRPIHISADLFGKGQPRPDLFVSPDHRILIQGQEAQPLFGQDQVLVAARDLLDTPGVRTDNRPRAVEYIHLMLDGHHIVTANGVACESFHPALADLSSLAPMQKSQLETLFPGIADAPMQFGDFARRLLTRAEAAILSYGLRA